MAACIGVFCQVVQISDTIYLSHSEMAAILLDQGVENFHGLLIVRVIDWKVLVDYCHSPKGELPVCSYLGVVDSNQTFQICTNREAAILCRGLRAIIKECHFPLAVKIPIIPEILTFR